MTHNLCRVEAFRRSLEWGDRIPTGIFYRHEPLALSVLQKRLNRRWHAP